MQKAGPSQNFVPIKEIRDGIAILKDGSMRALVLCSSMNFALKSEENQEAIIYQFQSFLNSLDFPIQIFIQSRRQDIRPYIALLEERYKEQTSDLMKLQTREYIDFIRSFTEKINIMSKSFFIVVPFSPAMMQGKTVAGVFGQKKTAKENLTDKMDQFEENKSQIMQRVGVVEQGMVRCGLRTAILGTEEVTELFYKIFNPGDTEKPITLISK